MTTEDDFQNHLNLELDDWQTRLVFADWLEEHGDIRACGYRALGLLRLRPVCMTYPAWNIAIGPLPYGYYRWSFHNGAGSLVSALDTDDGVVNWNRQTQVPAPAYGILPKAWFSAARTVRSFNWKLVYWIDQPGFNFMSRRECENHVATAFAKKLLRKQQMKYLTPV